MTVGSLNIPTVETERLLLRGWREEDAGVLAEIYSDEESSRYIGGKMEAWQAWRMLCTFIGHWQFRGFGLFSVEERETGKCLGWAGPWRPDGWPDNEIGYSFIRSSWGKGYATEAASAGLLYAYENLGWKTAMSCIDPANTASQAVAKRLGATHEESGVKVNFFTADVWRHLPPQEFKERFA